MTVACGHGTSSLVFEVNDVFMGVLADGVVHCDPAMLADPTHTPVVVIRGTCLVNIIYHPDLEVAEIFWNTLDDLDVNEHHAIVRPGDEWFEFAIKVIEEHAEELFGGPQPSAFQLWQPHAGWNKNKNSYKIGVDKASAISSFSAVSGWMAASMQHTPGPHLSPLSTYASRNKQKPGTMKPNIPKNIGRSYPTFKSRLSDEDSPHGGDSAD